ncbi:MAG: acyl-CoA dehydrogenase family protein [Planctomycetota bacterium]|jgi:alkylation response protein AidB-like acyl-CoA dehydrogenase
MVETNNSPQVIDFELSPELAEFQQRARQFAQEEIKPGAMQADREVAFPTDVIRKAGEQGFLGITTPEKYGGSMLGSLAACIMLEEINAACASTGVTVSVHISLFCAPLRKWGTEDQRARYCPKVATGEWLGAYCLSEADSGSDAAALRCEAKKDGDDYILNGPKLWVSTGQEASVYIVFARTGEDRVKGISAFLVERDFPGVVVGKKERKLGIKASSTTELLLEDVRIPKANLLGEEGKGFTIALDTLDGGRLGIAAQSLGITRACHDLIRDHLAQIRDHKGRPAASQAQQYQLADIAANLDGCRFLTWRAANLRDRGERSTVQSAMAKLCASKLSNHAARTAVSILGAEGASGASEAERLFRDARITEIYEGVTDIQRLVIARGVMAE